MKHSITQVITYGSLISNTNLPGEGNATVELMSISPVATGLPPGFAKLQRTVGNK